MTPYIKTQNFTRGGKHVKTMTIMFMENEVSLHYRMDKRGITSVKTRPVGIKEKLSEQEMQECVAAADDLVLATTGQTRYWQAKTAKVPVEAPVAPEKVVLAA